MKQPKKKEPILSPIQPVRDDSKVRDEEVRPIALELFHKIASLPDLAIGDSVTLNIDQLALYYQKVYSDVVVPVLRSSNLELNSMEYLFQIAVLPIERLQDAFYSTEKDVEAIILAKEIFAIMASHTDLPTGSFDNLSVAAYYRKIWDDELYPKLVNSKFGTVTYLFQLLRQPFQILSDLTVNSIKMNKEIADRIKWGKKTEEIRINDLDTALKESADAGVVDKSKKK